MGIGAEAPAGARRARAVAASRALRAAVAVLGLGCGEATLDDPGPDPGPGHASETETSTTSDTLPPLDTGELTSTGEASTGEPPSSDDPRSCAQGCAIVLPEDWVYEDAPPLMPLPPGTHVVPTMLREPDGALWVAEHRGGEARLYRLGGDGMLQWDVTLPLPCDPCELTDVALHPSGDLLLSASGVVEDETVLLAARYDPARDALVWVSTSPLETLDGVHVRSGGIAALPDDATAQLYMRLEPFVEFDIEQGTRLAFYGPEGERLDDENLLTDGISGTRPPLLARTDPDGKLLVGFFFGTGDGLRGLTGRLAPPLWRLDITTAPVALDDIVLDPRGHALELGHAFDGTRVYLQLGERAGVETSRRWSANLAIASTTSTPGALALGPDGDVYAVIRTTQALALPAEPLVGLSLSRWTPQGELRWSTTLLQAVAETWNPVELAIDDEEGLVVAAIVSDRLRVERRVQQCACEG